MEQTNIDNLLKPFSTVPVQSQGFCTDIRVIKSTHCWCIKNFSFCGQCRGQRIDSGIIRVGPNGELEFILRLYPKEMAIFSDNPYDRNKEFVSVFLGLLTNNTKSEDVFVKYIIAIKNASGKIIKSLSSQRHFVVGRHCGWYDFLDRKEYFSPRNEFMPSDELQVRCDIAVFIDKAALFKLDGDYKICIPKPTLSNDMTELMKSEKYSDVTIHVGDSKFRVHRAVLAARSPVFNAMFEHNMMEKNCGNIQITDFDAETIDGMLTFLYSGRVSVLDNETAKQLLAVADKYEINTLKRACENYLSKLIELDTVKELRALSEIHCADYLKSNCKDFYSCFIHKLLSSRRSKEEIEPKFMDIIDFMANISEQKLHYEDREEDF